MQQFTKHNGCWDALLRALKGLRTIFRNSFSGFLDLETLKMVAVCASETLVAIYRTTRCHKPEDHNLSSHLHGNVISQNIIQLCRFVVF
jgi:hypothetical protein